MSVQHHGISRFADSAKTVTSQHGISGVAVLVDQHLDKTA